MKSVAVIRADLETSPIGTASRLTEVLDGETVLRRTVERAAAARRLDGIVVACPTAQFDRVRALADHPKVTVNQFDGPEYPTRQLVHHARKWSLQSWRGGIGGTCFMDEHTHPAMALAVARREGCDAVLCMAAESPLVDPGLIDGMIAHYEQKKDTVRMVFAQAPPGLAPTVYQPALLDEVTQAKLTPGWVNSYRPDKPQGDMLTVPACYRTPLAIQHAAGRLTSDTRRGFEMLARILQRNPGGGGAESICRTLSALRSTQAEPLPREIHVELTTADQLGATLLRPRGPAVGRRGPLPVALFERIISQAAAYDDTLIVLGGFGEPLLHPQLPDLLRLCRRAGIFGVAIRTNGIALDPAIIQTIVEEGVDIVQVLLDATSAESYRAVHGGDHWSAVQANMQRLTAERRARGVQTPMLIPSLVKAKETFDQLDPFFDHGVREHGWCVIEGYSHHAGLLEDRGVMSMAPPGRVPCRQLWDRCMILADGRVVGCDQDFQARYVAGDLNEQDLAEIWHGDAMSQLRQAHDQGRYEIHSMCAQCEEWHRP